MVWAYIKGAEHLETSILVHHCVYVILIKIVAKKNRIMQKHVGKEIIWVTFYVLQTYNAAIWEMFSLFACMLVHFNILLEFGSADYVMVD